MRSILNFAVAALLVTGVHGQYITRTDPPVKKDIKQAYQKWLDNDISYAVTKDELADFLGLKTDEERDRFIEQYWLKRDAEQGPLNEGSERTIYADMNFTVNSLGSLTDRGRIYILWGEPDSIEYISGIPIKGRDDYVYCEKWYYKGREFTFIDSEETGDLRLMKDSERIDP